jgi:hypothetical protein
VPMTRTITMFLVSNASWWEERRLIRVGENLRSYCERHEIRRPILVSCANRTRSVITLLFLYLGIKKGFRSPWQLLPTFRKETTDDTEDGRAELKELFEHVWEALSREHLHNQMYPEDPRNGLPISLLMVGNRHAIERICWRWLRNLMAPAKHNLNSLLAEHRLVDRHRQKNPPFRLENGDVTIAKFLHDPESGEITLVEVRHRPDLRASDTPPIYAR